MEDLYRKKGGIVDFRKSHEEMKKIIELFQMPFSPQTKVNRLSVAHQQMVEIMKAYRRNSKIIAFDEPTASLPPKTAIEIVELLDEINMRGTTVVMSTHAKDIVDRMQKRVIAIEDGQLVRDEMKGGYGFEVQ